MATTLLARLTVANKDGNPKDGISVSLAMAGASTVATDAPNAAAGLQALFNASTYGAPNLGEYLATCMQSSGDIDVYDLAGHLDGSPHGSPVFSLSGAAIGNSGADSAGNQLAMTIAYHADLSGVVENGPVGPIKTPEIGIDWGAPATHPGVTKPRGSRRGRIFLGPLAGNIGDADGNLNRKIQTSKATAVATLMHAWTDDLTTTYGLELAVWSRTLATFHLVTGGWVDTELTTVRRRQFKPALRETWVV